MTTTRKHHSPQFKPRVATEAIQGEKTLSQLGSLFKVHPIQIGKWRKAALEQLPELFVDGRTRKANITEANNNCIKTSCAGWWMAGIRKSARGDGASLLGLSRPVCITYPQ